MARIVELRIENFRRIKVVEIRPDGSLVVVSGKNGHGKTSVLHAIWVAFKGRAVAGPTPISMGAEQCTIRCRTDEFTVTRSFKKNPEDELTTDLKVVMADGRKITSKPQAMLDALLPDLALDPLDFMRRPIAEQIDTMRGLVKGFDFDHNAKARKRAFDLRTDENRRAHDNAAAAEAVTLPDGPEPKAVDAAGLVQQMASASEHNATLAKRRERRTAAALTKAAKERELEELRVRVAALESEIADMDEQLTGAPALPEEIDVTALQQQIGGAEQVAAVRRDFQKRRDFQAAADTAQASADNLTSEIATLDAAKAAAIAKAKLPVPGLSFDENGITLNGLPFEQASTAEKLRASVAIGMALCPPPSDPALRIMTVDEGSELDGDSLALLHGMADQHGYQVWLARIDAGGENGVVIVDGAVGV